mgnify:CR=1 FL=1
MSFFEAYSGSEIKVSLFPFGEVLASPNAETFLFRRISIQLSLDGLLSSRARLCFTGQHQLKPLGAGDQLSAKTGSSRELPVDKTHTRPLRAARVNS